MILNSTYTLIFYTRQKQVEHEKALELVKLLNRKDYVCKLTIATNHCIRFINVFFKSYRSSL